MGLTERTVVVKHQGESYNALHITWDGQGSRVVTVRDVATEYCINGFYLALELIRHDENEPIARQILEKHAVPFLEAEAKKLENTPLAGLRYIFIDAIGDGVPPESEDLDKVQAHAQLEMAIKRGAPFLDWDFDIALSNGLATRFGATKAVWDLCRAQSSKMNMKDKAFIKDYQDALNGLLQPLKQLEVRVEAAETAARRFRRSAAGGASVRALSLLMVTHEVLSVYSQQDAPADRVASKARELAEALGKEVADDAFQAMKPEIEAIETFYKSKDFSKALYKYFEVWDSQSVFYFQAVAMRVVSEDTRDMLGFDERLQRILTRAVELLVMSDSHATAAAQELHEVAEKVWNATEDNKVSKLPRAKQRELGQKLLQEALNRPGAGWLSTIAVWSGTFTTYFGNMEGPPSVTSFILVQYSKTEAFLRALQNKDGLLRLALMWGFDETERNFVLALVKTNREDAMKLAKTVFNNGSWRSPSVFAAFYVLTAAVTLHHLVALVDAFRNGTAAGDIVAEASKLCLSLAQDALSFALIGYTRQYSKQMGAYLETASVARIAELKAHIERLEDIPAATTAHRAISGIGFVLAIWSLNDARPTADSTERLIQGLSAGAVGLNFLTVLVRGRIAFLGPWFFVAGVVLELSLAAYRKWLKPKFAIAMVEVSNTLANDSYIKSKESVVIRKTTFVAFLQTTVTIGDLLEDLRRELRDFPWRDRLNPNHKADYAHAGMPSDMIAKIYDITDDDEIRKLERLLKDARTQARRRAIPVPGIAAAFVQPAPAVPFVFRVGRHVEMRIEVTHPNRRRLPRVIWLQPLVPDARALLADNGQTPETTFSAQNVVMFFTHSTTRFGRIYQGSLRANFVPPNGKLPCFLFVPADTNVTSPPTNNFLFQAAPELTVGP